MGPACMGGPPDAGAVGNDVRLGCDTSAGGPPGPADVVEGGEVGASSTR
jgi:hypothetical protein